MESRRVRRPSVYLSLCKLCANRFFYQTNGWIATKLANHGNWTGLHSGSAEGKGRGQKSRDTDPFLISRNLSGGWLDRDYKRAHEGPRRACIQGVLKVNVDVKRHSSHCETVCQTVCNTVRFHVLLYMRSLYEAPLHSPSGISNRQLDLMSKSWNELCHRRSG